MCHYFVQQFIVARVEMVVDQSQLVWHGPRVKHGACFHYVIIVETNAISGHLVTIVMQPRAKVRCKHVATFLRILSAFFVLFE